MPDPPDAGECRRPAHYYARFVENKGETSGRQRVLSGREGTITVPVPDHRELATGTLRSIIRQSGVGRTEFEA